MRYYTIAGRVVEERAAVLSSTADRKKPRGVRRAGTSSLQKIKRNEGQSVQNLARGIALNFQPGDAFCTCKYGGRRTASHLQGFVPCILAKFSRAGRHCFT